MKMKEILPENLVFNSEFQQAVGSDKELKRLFNEEATEGYVRDMEMMAVFSDRINIGGYDFPVLTPGCLCLLEVIKSPLVVSKSEEGEQSSVTGMDVLKALYIMDRRERAVDPVQRICLRRMQLEKQKGNGDDKSAEQSEQLEKAKQMLQEAEHDFEDQVLNFYIDRPDIDFNEAFMMLNEILLQPGGFSMVPQRLQKTKSKKQRTFDADWLTRIVADVSEVSNSLPFNIIWRMSMSTVSYFIVQQLRRAGVKGIAPKTKSSEAMQRLGIIMMQFLNLESQAQALS